MPFDSTPRDPGDRRNGDHHFVVPYSATPGTVIIGCSDDLTVTFTAAAHIAAGTVVTLNIAPSGSTVTYSAGDAQIVTTATVEWRR
jgi:hypothetical protein